VQQKEATALEEGREFVDPLVLARSIALPLDQVLRSKLAHACVEYPLDLVQQLSPALDSSGGGACLGYENQANLPGRAGSVLL
jgi:hypothetical protein